MTNGVTLTDGTRTVTLTIVEKVESSSPANVAEIPIPARTTGGQIQFLGSPQWKYTITGILNDIAGTGGAGAAHTDDVADFEEGGYLELIKNNTAADCTFTYTYGSTVIHNGITTRVLDFPMWPVKGSKMAWFAYSIRLIRKQ